MQISSIIDELEDAIASGSPEKRLKALWQVMDLHGNVLSNHVVMTGTW
jgi:hypothetical protein